MTLAFFSPSVPEVLITLVVMALSLAWWVGVPYMLWLLLKRQNGAPGDRFGGFAGEGVFVELVVGDDGVLRAEVELGPRWAGRPARVVVEPIGRL